MGSVWQREAARQLGLQVWTNCRLYNAEGSDIARACKRLEKAALSAWKDSELPRKLGHAGEGAADASLDHHCIVLRTYRSCIAWACERQETACIAAWRAGCSTCSEGDILCFSLRVRPKMSCMDVRGLRTLCTKMGLDDGQKRLILLFQIAHVLPAGHSQTAEQEMPAADAPLPSWGGARRGKRASQAHGASSFPHSALLKRSTSTAGILVGSALYCWGYVCMRP